jgi:hypothetical protein
MRKKEIDRGLRRWRAVALLAAGLAIGVTMMATPAMGHVGGTVSHLWNDHIKPRADARYANAVAGTDKAKDANNLDGLDSLAFGQKFAKSGKTVTDVCSTPATWNECAPISITVPAGKTYQALITSESSMYEDDAANNVLFCVSARLSTAVGANCVGEERGLTVPVGEMEAITATTWRTLTAGTWVISGAINPASALDFTAAFDFGFTRNVVVLFDGAAPTLAGLQARVSNSQSR